MAIVSTPAIDEYMRERVYDRQPVEMTATIADTKDYTRVIFQGRDLVIHVMTLFYKECKHTARQYDFQMLYDTFSVDVQTFPVSKIVDFHEAIQDAVMNGMISSLEGNDASEISREIHDDEGFLVLRPRELYIVGRATCRRHTTISKYARDMYLNANLNHKRDKQDESLIPGGGWQVNILRHDIHYEVVDSLAMLFCVSEVNSQLKHNTWYRFDGSVPNEKFMLTKDLLSLFMEADDNIAIDTISYIMRLIQICTLSMTVSASRRNQKRGAILTPIDDDE